MNRKSRPKHDTKPWHTIWKGGEVWRMKSIPFSSVSSVPIGFCSRSFEKKWSGEFSLFSFLRFLSLSQWWIDHPVDFFKESILERGKFTFRFYNIPFLCENISPASHLRSLVVRWLLPNLSDHDRLKFRGRQHLPELRCQNGENIWDENSETDRAGRALTPRLINLTPGVSFFLSWDNLWLLAFWTHSIARSHAWIYVRNIVPAVEKKPCQMSFWIKLQY